MREEEPLDVIQLCTRHERSDRVRREMRHLKHLRRAQRRHQRPSTHPDKALRVNAHCTRACPFCSPIMPGDDHRARARLLPLLDLIRFVQPLALIRGTQLLRERVVAHTARVHHRPGRKDVLTT